MSDGWTNDEWAGRWVSGWVTVVLSLSAGCATAVGIFLALGASDTEVYESPLMLSVARQLVRGPWELYGPFGRQNPLVLIHAPLYYHLAALLAWAVKSAGLDPISAARLAGRLLSFAGLSVTACSAYAIARLDRAPRRSAWWAVCLIASSPVVGNMPYTVRPDMLGVALQTTGVFLLLNAIGSDRPLRRAIAIAFAALGIAICVKQHLLGGIIAGTFLLLLAWRSRRVSLRFALVGMLVAFVIVAVFYAGEEIATGGRMSQAVFVAAAAAALTHPADWVRAAIVLSAIGLSSAGMITILATAGLAQIAAPKAAAREKVVRAGFGLMGFAAIMPLVQTLYPSRAGDIVSAVALYVCLFVVIPGCMLVGRGTLFSGRLEKQLCLFVAVEVAIVVFLCRASTGAWINYGIQAIVFAAIITARSLARACENARSRAAQALIIVVSSTLLVVVLKDSFMAHELVRVERLTVMRLLGELNRPSSEIYFAGRPGLNRLYGQPDLVHDDWLYPVFESNRLAEPRSSWLELAVTRGSVRFIVSTSDDSRIDGVEKPLPALGYIRRFQIRTFYVWECAAARRPR